MFHKAKLSPPKSGTIVRHLLKVALAISLMLLSVESASADQVRAKIIGGDFRDLSAGPVALISTTNFLCSGILVGASEVLTAAHCVSDSTPNDDFTVVVGGEAFQVSSRYYNNSYNPDGDILNNVPYDLGILILSTEVTGTSPVPVLFKGPISKGQPGFLFGYGQNELTGDPSRDPLSEGKVGPFKVTSVQPGMIGSKHSSAGASSCHGDSGGPAIQVRGGYLSVIGTVSAGTNDSVGGACQLNYGGEFFLVDLQSSTSRRFLSFFQGVQYISGYRIIVVSSAEKLKPILSRAASAKSLATLKRSLSRVPATLSETLKYADGSRRTLLSQATRDVTNANRARSLSAGVAATNRALTKISQVFDMGPY